MDWEYNSVEWVPRSRDLVLVGFTLVFIITRDKIESFDGIRNYFFTL